MKLCKGKITMNDLWENYSFMLHKNGDSDSNRFITVKVKDFFDNVDFTEGEDE